MLEYSQLTVLWWFQGFPGGASGKEPACQCRRRKRCGFDPWVGKIPWRRAWQPSPVYLAWRSPRTEEPGNLQSMGLPRVRHEWSDLARDGFRCTEEWLSHTHTCSHSPPDSPPIQSSHSIEQSSLCYTVGSCWLSILNIRVCSCWSQTP